MLHYKQATVHISEPESNTSFCDRLIFRNKQSHISNRKGKNVENQKKKRGNFKTRQEQLLDQVAGTNKTPQATQGTKTKYTIKMLKLTGIVHA